MRPVIVSGALLLATALLGPVLAVAPSNLATNPAYLLDRQKSRELLARLISQLPVERRKAVTIGFNRFFKPLTFQVPDVLTNLLPSSSNLIKVHDDPKNGSKIPSSSQSEQSSTANPLLTYDPMQLLTNFDPNSFGKSNNQMPNAAFPFGNGTFDFDEASLANAVPNMLFGGHMSNAPMQMNEKFPTSIPLYHHESLSQLNNIRRPPAFYQSSRQQMPHHAHHQSPAKHSASFASPPGDDISDHLARLKQQYGLQLDEPNNVHRGPKRPMDDSHESYQQIHRSPQRSPYYSQEQKGHYSGDSMPNHYESYSGDKPSAQLYGDSMRNVENNEPMSYHYGARQPITFNDDYQHEFGNGRGQAERPRPEMDNDEPRYFHNNDQNKSNQMKMNQEQSNSNIGSYPDFYNQIPSSKEPLDMAENKPSNGDENKGSQQEIMASEQSRPEAGYTSYFNPLRGAASSLNPVVMSQDGRVPEPTENKLPLPAELSNIGPLIPLGLNMYPDPQLKMGPPRPVASRIKEFFKSMINQRY